MAGAAKLDVATVAAAAPVAPFRNLRRCTLSRGLEIFEDVFLVICCPYLRSACRIDSRCSAPVAERPAKI